MPVPVPQTPPPNYESDIIVLSDNSSNDDESTEPDMSSYPADVAFVRRRRHQAHPNEDEGAGLRSHSPPPFRLSGGPSLSSGRGAPIPSFSLGATRRESLPGETTSDRSERQMMEDAELARRLQVGGACGDVAAAGVRNVLFVDTLEY